MKAPHALVKDEIVLDVVEGEHPLPLHQRFHPSLIAYPCGPEVEHGWRYRNGKFEPPLPPGPEVQVPNTLDLIARIESLEKQIAALKR